MGLRRRRRGQSPVAPPADPLAPADSPHGDPVVDSPEKAPAKPARTGLTQAQMANDPRFVEIRDAEHGVRYELHPKYDPTA